MRALVLGMAVATAVPGWCGEAVYLVRGAQPASVARNGYVQSAAPLEGEWVRVEVATDPSPVGSQGWRARVEPQDLWVPEGFVLPPGLARRVAAADRPWERATRVLEWVMARVTYDAEDGGPQDAAAVLARGRGRCSGIANAAVGLLRAAGLPAHPVSGLLVRDGSAVPHRWLEVALPGSGWVPTDPTLGLWLVTPGHVACAGPAPAGVEVETVRRGENHLEVMPRRGPWPCRPELGATLECRVRRPAPGARAVLAGPGGQVRVARLGREVTFGGLLPGAWRLTLEREGRVLERIGIRLAPGSAHVLTLDGEEGSG